MPINLKTTNCTRQKTRTEAPTHMTWDWLYGLMDCREEPALSLPTSWRWAGEHMSGTTAATSPTPRVGGSNCNAGKETASKGSRTCATLLAVSVRSSPWTFCLTSLEANQFKWDHRRFSAQIHSVSEVLKTFWTSQPIRSCYKLFWSPPTKILSGSSGMLLLNVQI